MIENLGLYDIVIDLKNISRYTNSTNIYYKEGDINTAKIRARLKNKDININLIGVTVFIKIETPISKIEDEVTVIDAENGIIEYTFSTNALVQGANFFELILVKDGNVKVSQRLAYKVLDSIDDGDIESTNEYPILIQLISKAEKLIEDNESIKLNESIRIADEDIRKSNETKRQTGESTRESQEITRQQSITNMKNQFNALAPTESTNAEVQLARTDIMGKTHDSLQERLISDNKAQNTLFEEVNGSHISADTTEGYINDLVIEGCTIQDENNLSDIRSVGDKVEGQELYKIPLLCTGKNLFDGEFKHGYYLNASNGEEGGNNSQRSYTKNYLNIKGKSKLIVSGCKSTGAFFYDKNKKFISDGGNTSLVITVPNNAIYIRFTIDNISTYTNSQLEEGTVATPYEPYQEHKLTILSPVQLEKVGDVSDRIVERDGVWGVEKNNIDYIPDIKKLTNFTELTNCIRINYSVNNLSPIPLRNIAISNILQFDIDCNWDKDEEGFYITKHNNTLIIRLDKTKATTKVGAQDWIKNNDMFIKYPTTKPQFIPLPNSQQIKLRTLPNKTNISFLTEIEGTIKGKVPKSLSATVNTHTTQIDNLNTDLERVKKLEESTVSTVKNDGKDFVSVESTNQGYFEDVRLEGKTLVNDFTPRLYTTNLGESIKDLCTVLSTSNSIKLTVNQSLLDITGNIWRVLMIHTHNWCLNKIKPSTNYTILFNVNTNVLKNMDIRLCEGSGQYNIFENNVFKPISGLNKINIKTLSTFPLLGNNHALYFSISSLGNIGDYMEISNVCMFEGNIDYIPQYFEGLKSVGEGTDEIVVSSFNENLFNFNKLYRYDNTIKYAILDNNSIEVTKNNGSKYHYVGFINKLQPGCKYEIGAIITNTSNTLCGIGVKHYTTNGGLTTLSSDVTINNSKREFITPSDGLVYINFYPNLAIEGDSSDTMVVKDIFIRKIENNSNPIVNSKSNKKRLLRLNPTTQIWEKPILREWDYVEKRSDGEYYNIDKSGQVVLDGSENWNANTANDGFLRFVSPKSDIKINSMVVCDKFTPSRSDLSKECIYVHPSQSELDIVINKSKLETQDVAGFKKWLQVNPVTVTYQLAKPKEYKCTNIDLISYPNETNLYINSGPITSNLTAKYHGNIANTMIILQNKVNLLENKFMAGLKSVLAGNMQELAYSLYPNDFNMSTTLEL